MRIPTLTRAAILGTIGLPLLIITSASAQGNSGRKDKHLAVDDPELQASFFLFMEDFSAWLDVRGNANPAKRDPLMASAARYLRVDVKELPKIAATCRSAATNLRRINDSAAKLWADARANGKRPDSAALNVLAAQRFSAIQSAMDDLSRALSSASWDGLHAYINSDHRNTVTRIDTSNKGGGH